MSFGNKYLDKIAEKQVEPNVVGFIAAPSVMGAGLGAVYGASQAVDKAVKEIREAEGDLLLSKVRSHGTGNDKFSKYWARDIKLSKTAIPGIARKGAIRGGVLGGLGLGAIGTAEYILTKNSLEKRAEEDSKKDSLASILAKSTGVGAIGAGIGGGAGYLAQKRITDVGAEALRQNLAEYTQLKNQASRKMSEAIQAGPIVLPGGAHIGVGGPSAEEYLLLRREEKAAAGAVAKQSKHALKLKVLGMLTGAGIGGSLAALGTAGYLVNRNKNIDDQQFIKPWVNV